MDMKKTPERENQMSKIVVIIIPLYLLTKANKL